MILTSSLKCFEIPRWKVLYTSQALILLSTVLLWYLSCRTCIHITKPLSQLPLIRNLVFSLHRGTSNWIDMMIWNIHSPLEVSLPFAKQIAGWVCKAFFTYCTAKELQFPCMTDNGFLQHKIAQCNWFLWELRSLKEMVRTSDAHFGHDKPK